MHGHTHTHAHTYRKGHKALNPKIIGSMIIKESMLFLNSILCFLTTFTAVTSFDLSMGLCGRQRTYNYAHFIG